MVAKKGTKRQAAAAAPAAPKQARLDPAMQGVLETLAMAENLPDNCRKMLEAGVPCSLGTPKNDRHEMQKTVVAMIGEVVEGVQAKLQEALDAEIARLGEVESRRTELQGVATTAESAQAVAAKDVEEKTLALTQATDAALVAKSTLTEKRVLQRSGDAAMLQTKESKAALEKGIQEDLSVIVEGVAEDLTQHYEALLPLLENAALDDSLMSALPSVCSKKAATRGAFDTMVLEQLAQTLRDRAAALAKTVEDALPAAQEREATTQEAQTKFDEVSSSQEVAGEALSTASLAQQAAEKSLTVARDGLAAFEPEYAAATRQRDEKAQKLKDFKLFNVAGFETLRDRETVSSVTAGGA